MLNGLRVPSTKSFDGKRDERDTLSVACVVGGTELPIPSILQGVARLSRFSVDDGIGIGNPLKLSSIWDVAGLSSSIRLGADPN